MILHGFNFKLHNRDIKVPKANGICHSDITIFYQSRGF